VLIFNKWVSWQLIENSIYVFDERTNQLYGFDSTAKEIWTAIYMNMYVHEVINYVCSLYPNVEAEIIKYDVTTHIDNLIELELISYAKR